MLHLLADGKSAQNLAVLIATSHDDTPQEHHTRS
jgi:hypothetical protein